MENEILMFIIANFLYISTQLLSYLEWYQFCISVIMKQIDISSAGPVYL